MAKVLIKVDKNGTKYWADYVCDRCGGQGASEAWKYTGLTCYKCGGSGRLVKPNVWKEYTPEHQQKLDEQRKRRLARELAKRKAEAEAQNAAFLRKNCFDADGFTYVVLGDTYDAKDQLKALGCVYDSAIGWRADRELEGYDTMRFYADDFFRKDDAGCYYRIFVNGVIDAVRSENARRKAEAQKAETGASDYIGEVGKRITVNAVIKSRYDFKVQYGWKEDIMRIYTFIADGNVLVWKTTGYIDAENGSAVTLTGTVKEHSEYKGTKQTVLTRCKVS